jgi:putative transcriptional regulator
MSKTAKCTTCRQAMTSSVEDYVYDESGLSRVMLEGIEVRRCTNRDCEAHGATVPVIPNVEGLHSALARAIIEQRTRLSGEEVRFLRTHLGFRGVDFARVMGVAKETVSRWENDPNDPIGPQADRALRLLVFTQKPVSDYSPEALTELLQQISDKRRSTGLRVHRRQGIGWRAQEVTA